MENLFNSRRRPPNPKAPHSGVFLHQPLPHPLSKPMPENPPPPLPSRNVVHKMAPSTGSRSSNSSPRCHVFISCHNDVRNEFPSLFHYILTDCHKLEVCSGKDELPNGHLSPGTTRHTISSALVHIAIFCPSYVKCPRCLDELLWMLESRAKIIPFYYNLQPSDLRWVNINMQEEDQASDPETIQKWRKALQGVSYTIGHVFNPQIDSHGSVLNKIVDMVLSEVRSKQPSYVADHPVGLEKAVEHLAEDIRKSEQLVVGIVGPPGVGKTAWVTQFINSKRSDYKKCCCLFDVRKRAEEDPLQALQCKLIEQLCHTDWPVGSTREGKERLAQCLDGVPALIIIDDIGDASQLHALLLEKEAYAPHSLIIVTSRDKGVLERWGISFIHKVNALDAADARKLFCLHAFGQDHPRIGFEYLVEDVLTECEGSPLSLKIYGESFNSSKDPQNWKVSQACSEKREINAYLKSSYDALTEEEKGIFLWCASSSVETDKGTAIAELDKLGLNGSYGLEALQQKCLIEYNDNNCLKMSKHLRDLGRHVKHEMSLKDLHKGHCPCQPKDLSDLTKQQSPQVTWWKYCMHLCCCCCCSAHATS